jgi:hypothetical protein
MRGFLGSRANEESVSPTSNQKKEAMETKSEESSQYHNPDSLMDPVMSRQPDWVKRLEHNFRIDVPSHSRQKRQAKKFMLTSNDSENPRPTQRTYQTFSGHILSSRSRQAATAGQTDLMKDIDEIFKNPPQSP